MEASKKTGAQEAKNDKHNQTNVDKRNVEIEIPQYDDNGNLAGSSVWEAEISVLNDTKTAYDISKLRDITKNTHSDLRNLQEANPNIDRVSLSNIVSQQKNFVKSNSYKNVSNAENEPIVKNSLKESTSDTQIKSDNFKQWFGDWENDSDNASKVVNEDGTPKVMYRGDTQDIEVFDRKKTKPSNLYGRGFYFTDSESHASQYGEAKSYYLDIKNPLVLDRHEITKEQLIKFLESVSENEDDYDIWNYGTTDIYEIADNLYGKGDFETLQDVSATAIGDLVEATELFNAVNGTDYDGFILPTETVVFRSNQIKSATDNVGTFDKNNADIRYSIKENDLSTDECQKRFAENVDKVLSGEMPSRTVINIGDTPKLLQKYSASSVPITINQSVMYKIAYPAGYFGAEKQGHNLGIPALKQLPKQIADPVAILKSTSQDKSMILLTEWQDTHENPVIIPLHLDKDGSIGIVNDIASAYGKQNFDTLLTDSEGNSTVLYTKNNEDIHRLTQSGLQLPGASTEDTLINYNIPNPKENVKFSKVIYL